MQSSFTATGSGASTGMPVSQQLRQYGLPTSRMSFGFNDDARPPKVNTARHGSGEHGARGRRPRSRERSEQRPNSEGGNIRAAPAGVQERTDWLEALQDMRDRVAALERQTGKLAHGVAGCKEVQAEHAKNFEVIDKDLIDYKKYVENMLYHDPLSIKNTFDNMEKRYNTHVSITTELLQVRSDAIDDQFAALGIQVEEIKSAMQSKFFNMESGQTPAAPRDPMQASQHDPWARSNQDWQNPNDLRPPTAPAAMSTEEGPGGSVRFAPEPECDAGFRQSQGPPVTSPFRQN